jgi:hypothetical protein
VLPKVGGLLATKEVLFGLVRQYGIEVMQQVFAAEAEKLVGSKGRQQKERRLYHWGWAPTGSVPLPGAGWSPAFAGCAAPRGVRWLLVWLSSCGRSTR